MNLKQELELTAAAGGLVGDTTRAAWTELLERQGGGMVRMAIGKLRQKTSARQVTVVNIALAMKHKLKTAVELPKEQQRTGLNDGPPLRSPVAAPARARVIATAAEGPAAVAVLEQVAEAIGGNEVEDDDEEEEHPPTPAGPPPALEPIAKGITAAVEQITPGRAQAWLLKSMGNRELRRQHIAWLAAQMREGSWEVTGQAIVFASDGRLLDGHHRLHGVIASGCTVAMLVVYGVPPTAWGKLDCGVVRAVHDRLQLLDGPSNNRRAVEILQQLRRIEQLHRGKLTPETIRQDWELLQDHAAAVLAVFPKKVPGLTRIPVLCALVRYHQREPVKALELAQQLLTGANLASDAPGLVLRNWLMIGFSQDGSSTAAIEIYWRCVGACKAHRDGKRMASLVRATTWGTEGELPAAAGGKEG